jgi:hypothetical protein
MGAQGDEEQSGFVAGGPAEVDAPLVVEEAEETEDEEDRLVSRLLVEVADETEDEVDSPVSEPAVLVVPVVWLPVELVRVPE